MFRRSQIKFVLSWIEYAGIFFISTSQLHGYFKVLIGCELRIEVDFNCVPELVALQELSELAELKLTHRFLCIIIRWNWRLNRINSMCVGDVLNSALLVDIWTELQLSLWPKS